MLIEEVQLPEFRIDPVLAEMIPRSFCRASWWCPSSWRAMLMAMADPLDEGLIDEVRFTAGLDLRSSPPTWRPSARRSTSSTATARGLQGAGNPGRRPDPYEGIEIVIEDDDSARLEDLLRETEAPPAIRLANAIIIEAIRLGASDIHIQPRTKSVVVRYRIDGVLIDKIHIPTSSTSRWCRA
jgi:type II secretory ATPase GspE/PulE/Tfp pilus assembly ATPase PilB-like protein